MSRFSTAPQQWHRATILLLDLYYCLEISDDCSFSTNFVPRSQPTDSMSLSRPSVNILRTSNSRLSHISGIGVLEAWLVLLWNSLSSPPGRSYLEVRQRRCRREVAESMSPSSLVSLMRFEYGCSCCSALWSRSTTGVGSDACQSQTEHEKQSEAGQQPGSQPTLICHLAD